MKYNHRAKRWEAHYSITNPHSNWREIYDYMWKTFGHPGTDPETGVYSGWDYDGGSIYLYDEKSVILFKLRWE